MTIDPRYLTQLDELGGIVSYQVGTGVSGHDAVLMIKTAAATHRLLVDQYRSHLTHKLADQIVANLVAGEDLLLLAPHIGKKLAAKFEQGGINYLDGNGNCHIEVGAVFIHVEGRRGNRADQTGKGLRSAGYQVLFTYLAEPALINATVRSVAQVAGVSTQPVHDMKHRLLDAEYVVKTKSSIKWLPRRRQDALSLWLHGYDTTVRPSLVWGRYRSQDDHDELEARLPALLESMGLSDFRWGGTSAGYRLAGHYRGPRTTVHVQSLPGDFRKRARVVTDSGGNLVLMNARGELNWQPGRPTVHPLLVYSEMLRERSERAREAAQQLFDELIQPGWDRAT